MNLTFIYIDDSAQSVEVNEVRRKMIVEAIRNSLRKQLRGEEFDRFEPRLADIGEMIEKSRIGYLICLPESHV